ncbi:phosphoribosylformylglycinamidine synthase subunit PurL [Paludisphaera mucosa]|uniref:Phosphoribosylformylglycinamidine synthase subunit PurL n=1 Tax=Paludisphaera mucosa TaxID=3030827 RepID=A0ABT6F6Z3_9BACT|nr:phosphoribosylformylglycinamidine synthase subunit PurL [Paludisphaera mucosa]MDG3003363.1 phosphoribosylformylglycinamidine synthase subunit PurL [Paludisphaera mucosa]
MLWHLDIAPASDRPDSTGLRIAQDALESGLAGPWRIAASRGFLVEGPLTAAELGDAARQVLVDPVVESFRVEPCPAADGLAATIVHVFPKAGVTDPEGESALALLRDLGYAVDGARSIRSYRVEGPADLVPRLIQRVLANDAVEQAVVGPLHLDHLGEGRPYDFALIVVPIRAMDDATLVKTSKDGQLSLSLAEMHTIQAHFRELGRDPTDCELETLAQTWSEHCSHKTLRGRIDFDGAPIANLLKRTIFSATQELDLDWLVSVFSDNAGVVRFDDEYDVCFKVETHNHPSAIDPYGGSNTGIGGVIRDALGTGLGAKPICNTDVFCVAPPDMSPDRLPAGVLHPKRVLKGVVAGVRDYGNRMGIPTVNGALAVDPAYLGNPLVFCGTVGVLPRGKAFKSVEPGDRIVALGGRTGRDGIHGATFSSVELTSESESISGGAVQIGNAITEKMVLDVIVRARDLGLFRALTDCGAGGFSSAVGEMGADTGAVVDLEKAPLKYQGLSYTEIWISEAQERMVLAVPPESWPEFRDLCELEGVEATDLGEFVDTGRLTLRYHGQVVGDLAMDFLHEGRPDVVRSATYKAPEPRAIDAPASADFTADLLAILGHWDVCSKEWIVRQYDHEVQSRTVVKPLVGERENGPGDASVILPVVGSNRGLAVSCGINPRYGRLDPYAMAACVIDEAVRNCVAVGADPDRIALLDNFCWGNPERPETLGTLVRAAQACRDLALAYRTPFISGKDSLYNEYAHEGKSLAIPPTLLISAIGQVPDVRRCTTMDFKAAGNLIVLLGTTRLEFGGSLFAEARRLEGGVVPAVDAKLGLAIFKALHRAISQGLVRSCHDLSEGGLAVALAESAFAGRIGAEVSLRDAPRDAGASSDAALLFSESPSRFLLEVEPARFEALAEALAGLPFAKLGSTVAAPRLVVDGLEGGRVLDASLDDMEAAWRRPLDW